MLVAKIALAVLIVSALVNSLVGRYQSPFAYIRTWADMIVVSLNIVSIAAAVIFLIALTWGV